MIRINKKYYYENYKSIVDMLNDKEDILPYRLLSLSVPEEYQVDVTVSDNVKDKYMFRRQKELEFFKNNKDIKKINDFYDNELIVWIKENPEYKRIIEIE